MERSSEFDIVGQAAQSHPASLASTGATADVSSFRLSSSSSGDLDRAEADFSSPASASYDSRALDVVVATLLLLLILPLMCLCALAVIGTSRGPLLFRHARIGRHGELFQCLKFRTMIQDADRSIEEILSRSPQRRDEWQSLHKLHGDPRVTRVGAFLRRYCLDELPQLFNVLAGEMSIVGPRPIVTAETERYGTNFSLYCSVRPGLTGLWQISGRHRLSYPERVELDATYARSRSLSMDVAILVRTIPVVLMGANE